MHNFDFATPVNKLRHEFEALTVAWHEASDSWSDSVRDNFAANHLEPLGPAMKTAVEAVERFAAVLAAAESECGDDAI